jgi:hypothetical protein
MAFFVQLALTRGRGGAEILPVLWEDNYFSLLPGESREITARFAVEDAGNDVGANDYSPLLEVGGWNVESGFDCVGLAAAPKEAKAGESVTVTANISNTFLDGSRVPLRLDGKVVDAQWVWARRSGRQALTFRMAFDRPGRHTLEVGGRKLELSVEP